MAITAILYSYQLKLMIRLEFRVLQTFSSRLYNSQGLTLEVTWIDRKEYKKIMIFVYVSREVPSEV